jgi:CHAT domain-containing protein/Flp pilus assembly protein TadD
MRILFVLLLLAVSLPTVGTIRKSLAKSTAFQDTPAEIRELLISANKLYVRGDFVQAAPLYQKGITICTDRQEYRTKAKFLHGLGNCHLLATDYQNAVAEFLEARKLSTAASDWNAVTFLSTNLYIAYNRMNDSVAAAEAMQAVVHSLPRAVLKDNLPHVLINVATAKSDQGQPAEAEKYFGDAIFASDNLGDIRSSVAAWSELGYHHLRREELDKADRAYTRAFYLRRTNRLGEIADSYRDFGMLRLAEGDWESATRFLTEGISVARRQPIGFPVLIFYNYLGRARVAGGDLPGALADFETALKLANEWRLDVVSTDSSRTAAEVRLDDLYTSYIDTGMALYARNHSPDLAYKMFQAAEDNRAVSFRERLNGSRKFPPEFWQTLANLRRAEIVLFRKNTLQERDKVQRLRVQLAEIESQRQEPYKAPPSTYSHREYENSLSVKSLTPFQALITDDEALISFHLGESKSYIWAFTRSGFEVHVLPDRARISRSVRAFQDAIRTGAPDAAAQGQSLYSLLFGSLKLNALIRKDWLLVLDDTLFELPFAALVTSSGAASTSFLIERNSLRVLPAAGMLRIPRQRSPEGPFLGIGDPIYNTADSRWLQPSGKSSWRSLFRIGQQNAISALPEFTRLVGSGLEIQASASAWHSGSKPVLLQGNSSRRIQIEQHLKTGPAVAHFATHVVQPLNQPDQAMIAIGLDPAGEADFFTTTEISNWRYPLGLVVLSGCSSGTGKALPGAGLFGLTRAWLLAGARTVTASQWPTPDDSGPLFQSFYKSLRLTRQGLSSASAADALQTAQIGMLRSGTWRAEPKFWAAFFVVGKD